MDEEESLWIDYESLFEDGRRDTPEVKLWRAVIGQTFSDCQMNSDGNLHKRPWYETKSNPQLTFDAVVYDEAQELRFQIHSDWFSEVVCENAEMQAYKVRKACEMILRGEVEFRYFTRRYNPQRRTQA